MDPYRDCFILSGKGAVYSFDPVGSYQRDSFKAGGSASAMLQPLLDNQVRDCIHAACDVDTKCFPLRSPVCQRRRMETSGLSCVSLLNMFG